MTVDELKKLVAAMRELGVTQCDGVVLGPEPYPRKSGAVVKDWEAPPDDEPEVPKRQTIEEFRKKAGR